MKLSLRFFVPLFVLATGTIGCKKDETPKALPANYGTITIGLSGYYCCKKVNVSIDGQDQTISKVFTSLPECGENGTAVFKAAPHSTRMFLKCAHRPDTVVVHFPGNKGCTTWWVGKVPTRK